MNIKNAINRADPEFRIAIHAAWLACDGTMESLRGELETQAMENPGLDVDDVMYNAQLGVVRMPVDF